MTSDRQTAANRANARHSTGPKTSEGIAAVRLNALQHGLLTRDVVLPEEDAGAFDDLFNQVRTNLSPVGPIEEFLADRVVNAMWRLRRLERAETALFHSLIYRLKADQLATEVRSYQQDFADHLAIALRPEITDKAAHTEASEALKRAQYEQNRDEVLLGRAIDADAREGDAFAKLARYERSLERSFPSGPRRASPHAGQTPEPSLPADLRRYYAELRKYRMTNSRQDLGLLMGRGRSHFSYLGLV